MGNIIVSIAIKRNIVAIVIIENGMIKSRVTEKIKDEKALSSNYSSMIYAFTIALRHVRQYIQSNKDSSRNVCFETSNSIFIKWVDNQYSKDAYQEDFEQALKLLQELPIKYAFTYAPRPKAIAYTEEKYCKKESVSGLNLDEYDE